MQGNALVALEHQLKPLAPRFAQVLPPGLPVERLMRTVMVSVERLPMLLECDRQSLFNAAMSAACLGLEVDGVTGQAYLIPFKNRAQLVVGYKGYNTLAARSGITITGEVVRDGDAFDFDEGEGWVKHKRKLGNKGRIIAAWAKASSNDRPPVVKVMGLDDLLAVKAKSPGASRRDSPWNDEAIGFPAMCEKTVKRRLARSLPLNVMHLAARLDEAVDEQGLPAHISPDKGVIIEGEFTEPAAHPTMQDLVPAPRRSEPAPREAAPSPTPEVPQPDGAAALSASEYVAKWMAIIQQATDAKQLAETWNNDKAARDAIDWPDDGSFNALKVKVGNAVTFLKQPARV